MEASLKPEGLGIRDFGGWSLFTYLWIFLCGYLLVAEPRLELAAQRLWPLALALTVLGTGVVVAGGWLASILPANAPLFSIIMGCRALAAWCGIVTCLAIARRRLSFNTPFLRYANEAVLPFYILHQPVILLVGFYGVAGWPMAVLLKYLVLAIVSFVIIVALYELLVRRNSGFRFLFGLHPGIK